MSRIITRVTDGLGNQLFHYAVGFAAAKRADLPLDLDVTWYSRMPSNWAVRKLHVCDLVGGAGYRKKLIYGRRDRAINFAIAKLAGSTTKDYQFGLPVEQFSRETLDEYRHLNHGCYITGSPFNYELFTEYMQEVRTLFSKGLLSSIPKPHIESDYAFLHVRRGDIAENEGLQNRIGLLPAEYYVKCMESYEADFGRTNWVVCSDSPQEAIKVLPKRFDLTPSPGSNELEDLSLMTCAKGGIIANSTFSFWGGLLGTEENGRIFAPKPWWRDGRPGIPLPSRWRTVEFEY